MTRGRVGLRNIGVASRLRQGRLIGGGLVLTMKRMKWLLLLGIVL
jgi:hypothetical protein